MINSNTVTHNNMVFEELRPHLEPVWIPDETSVLKQGKVLPSWIFVLFQLLAERTGLQVRLKVPESLADFESVTTNLLGAIRMASKLK